MTLRTRMALLVGAIAALAMLIGGILSYAAVRQEQYDTIDRFLDRRGAGQEQILRERDFDSLPFERLSPPVDDRVTFQVNTPDGSVILASNPDVELPLPEPDEMEELRTISLDGERFRVSAELIDDGNIVQLGQSLTEADDTVAAIRNQLWLLGVTVSAIAAALGWIAAGRISRPLERLTGAADHIALTTDLDGVEAPGGSPTTRFEVGRLAASFSAMLEALRGSREQQQQLVVDAGHEMRTPLTTVRTNVELLQSGRLSTDDRARSLEAIAREVDELTNLTSELVELSAATGSGEQAQTVDLYEVAVIAAERARSRHGRVVVVTGETSPVIGQAASLDRAVTNLIDNAVKFSPSVSQIDVDVELGRVSVRDRGPGIAAHERELVFQRFYRAPAARTLPGSGLGLAIVAKIAADHGGNAFVADPADGTGIVIGFSVAVS